MIISHKPRIKINLILCIWNSPLSTELCILLATQCRAQVALQNKVEDTIAIFHECTFNAGAIQTKEIVGMNFKSHAVSNTIALIDWLSKYGELGKECIMKKPSKNFDGA